MDVKQSVYTFQAIKFCGQKWPWVQKQILTLPNDTANFRTTAVDCIKGSLHVAEILADPKAEFLAVFSSAESKVGIQLLLQKVRQSAVSLFELEQGFSI